MPAYYNNCGVYLDIVMTSFHVCLGSRSHPRVHKGRAIILLIARRVMEPSERPHHPDS